MWWSGDCSWRDDSWATLGQSHHQAQSPPPHHLLRLQHHHLLHQGLLQMYQINYQSNFNWRTSSFGQCWERCMKTLKCFSSIFSLLPLNNPHFKVFFINNENIFLKKCIHYCRFPIHSPEHLHCSGTSGRKYGSAGEWWSQ